MSIYKVYVFCVYVLVNIKYLKSKEMLTKKLFIALFIEIQTNGQKVFVLYI